MAHRLLVKIIEAKNLVSTDSNGKADAYVILKINGIEKGRTKVKKRTLTPQWNETFTVDISDPQSELLHLSVCHKDMFKDDTLGDSNIPLKDLTKDKEDMQWYPVYRPKRSTTATYGYLCVVLKALDFGKSQQDPANQQGNTQQQQQQQQGNTLQQPGQQPGFAQQQSNSNLQQAPENNQQLPQDGNMNYVHLYPELTGFTANQPQLQAPPFQPPVTAPQQPAYQSSSFATQQPISGQSSSFTTQQPTSGQSSSFATQQPISPQSPSFATQQPISGQYSQANGQYSQQPNVVYNNPQPTQAPYAYNSPQISTYNNPQNSSAAYTPPQNGYQAQLPYNPNVPSIPQNLAQQGYSPYSPTQYSQTQSYLGPQTSYNSSYPTATSNGYPIPSQPQIGGNLSQSNLGFQPAYQPAPQYGSGYPNQSPYPY